MKVFSALSGGGGAKWENGKMSYGQEAKWTVTRRDYKIIIRVLIYNNNYIVSIYIIYIYLLPRFHHKKLFLSIRHFPTFSLFMVKRIWSLKKKS